jgi:protein TonB
VYTSEPSAVQIGIGISLALHALAAADVLSYTSARKASPAAAPILVARLAPPKTEVRPSEPAIGKPKPGPVGKIAAPPEAPSAVAAIPTEASPIAAASTAGSNPAPQPLAAAAEPALITAPVFNASYLDNPAPAYPSLSRRLGEQGKVILRVLVNAGGTTDAVELRASSGHPRLDDAAQDTVRRWKFVPARHGAEPCAAWVLIPILFRLEG